MEVLNKDALWSVLLKVDPYDLKNVCIANKQTNNICRDPKFKEQYDDIWFGRLKRNYTSNPSLGLRRAAQYNYPQLFPYFLNLGADPLEIYRGLAIGKHYDLLDKIIETPIVKPSGDAHHIDIYIDYEDLINNRDLLIEESVIAGLGEIADLKTLEKYKEYTAYLPVFEILYSGNDKMLKDILDSEDYRKIFFDGSPFHFYGLLETYPQFKPLEGEFEKKYKNSQDYDDNINQDLKKLNPLYKYVKNQDLEEIKSFLQNSETPASDAEIVSFFVAGGIDHPLEIVKILLPYLGRFKGDLYVFLLKDKDTKNYIKNYLKDNDPTIYRRITRLKPDEKLPVDIKVIKSVFNL